MGKLPSDKITVETAMTALCVWEELLARHEAESDAGVDAMWDAIGTASMRVMALEIAELLDGVWHDMDDDKHEFSFDWEFCPAAIDYVIWDVDNQRVSILPTKEIVPKVLQKLRGMAANEPWAVSA